MSEKWARTVLAAYRLAGAAAFPLVGPYIAWRATKGKEDPNRRHERSGYAGKPRPDDWDVDLPSAARRGSRLCAPLGRAGR